MVEKHPSLDIVGSDGTELAGKKIILCISGSVAAYKAIELARLFMRHGGDVTCVASKAATDLIQPSYFKWATGNQVITKLTGDLEHIKVADYKQSDCIVVYPCTANTLGKLANGIDDTTRKQVMELVKGTGSGNNEVVLEEKINKDLIGGFIIRVGDKQVDASIARKLNNLKRGFKENPFVKEF